MLITILAIGVIAIGLTATVEALVAIAQQRKAEPITVIIAGVLSLAFVIALLISGGEIQ